MLLFKCQFCVLVFFFFKQKTAYEMRISDWSSDVCSSDLDRELTVSGMIRHHATVAPMAQAVDFGGRSMTYADLDRIADRIAATLAAMGLAPGDRVLRSEGSRGGKECVSSCRSRGPRSTQKKKQTNIA